MAVSWNSNSAVQESGLKQQLLSNWLRNTELCLNSIFSFILSLNLTAYMYVFKEIFSYVGIRRYMHKSSHIVD